MRLLNVKTLELKTFHNRRKRPEYAILSHTWGENEFTFEDVRDLATARKLPGFSKIESCCRIAREQNRQWVWIDTCCIDKSSSAELSEAINSMFKWYEEAVECYAYLEDVRLRKDLAGVQCFEREEFARSRWFTRAWTLQELIAPTKFFFFSANWELLAERQDLVEELLKITTIARPLLHDHYPQVDVMQRLSKFSIAQKMSWASNRESEREEDVAYSLMGIFDVNMPLLYGEGGTRAFLRLQEEILKRTEDHSIFLWKQPLNPYAISILANSPDAFADSGSYVPFLDYRHTHEVTNLGLRMTLPVMFLNTNNLRSGYVGITGTQSTQIDRYHPERGSIRMAIPLVPHPHHRADNRRQLRAMWLPLLEVHFINHQQARVVNGRTGVSEQPFQYARLVTIYVKQTVIPDYQDDEGEVNLYSDIPLLIPENWQASLEEYSMAEK